MGLFSKRIEKQIESYQHELIETHYREVDNMYRQIRGWRHDYRNHIQTMKAYAATENWKAIKNYLDLLDEDLTTVDTVIKTGNPMTDAILNSKISLAKSTALAVSSRSACLILTRAFEVTTMFSQSRLGVWVGAVTMETVSPLFKVYLIGTFFSFTFAETHLHPNLVWIAKAKSSTVAPLASLISSPVGVKT